MKDQQDAVLIDRAVAGDTLALEQLLEAHYPTLLQYVTRHLPRPLRRSTDPADIVQETYFEACRLIAGFVPSGEGALYRWLATIARNRMLMLLRKASTRHETAESERAAGGEPVITLLEQLAVYRRTPSRSAAAHELMGALEGAIDRLPADFRHVVILRHLQGLTVAETAARMNKRPEAVYWLCSRALQAIRAELESSSHFK